MSGRKIDDHESWIGKGSKGVVYPAGAKMKEVSPSEGAGSVGKYEDTEMAIKSQQQMSKKKIAAHAPKDEYRN